MEKKITIDLVCEKCLHNNDKITKFMKKQYQKNKNFKNGLWDSEFLLDNFIKLNDLSIEHKVHELFIDSGRINELDFKANFLLLSTTISTTEKLVRWTKKQNLMPDWTEEEYNNQIRASERAYKLVKRLEFAAYQDPEQCSRYLEHLMKESIDLFGFLTPNKKPEKVQKKVEDKVDNQGSKSGVIIQ